METMCKDAYKEMYNLTLNALKNNNFQDIQKMYSIYSLIYFMFRDSQNGVVNYLCFLHSSKGSKEEKSRIIYNYIFPEFANDSEFKFAVDSFFKSGLAVNTCDEINTWSGKNGNRIREQIDEKKLEKCDGTQYLSQILLITNSKVVIKNYYGIGNVIEISKENIVNNDHNFMGKIVDEIKYLKI